jgi:anti-sigma factor RsiW
LTDCRQIESLLPPYVDGEASSRDVAEVEAHLAACPDCARLVQAQRTMRTVLRARAAQLRVPTPPGLSTRVAALVQSGGEPRLGWAGRLTAFGAAAVVLLSLIVGFEFISPRSGVLLAAQLAIDHVRCFTIALGSLGSSDPKAVAREYADHYGWTVPVPASNAAAGIRLIGARRCPFWLGDHAHLLYRHGDRDVSLYVTPGDTRGAEQLSVFGHAERIWASGGNSYALIARGLSDVELARVADYFEQATAGDPLK